MFLIKQDLYELVYFDLYIDTNTCDGRAYKNGI